MQSTMFRYGLTPDLLHRHYVVEGRTIRQIADSYGCKWGVIQRALTKLGYADNIKRTATYLVRNAPLTYVQRQVVIGSILGDGHLFVDSRNCQLRIGHKESQLPYLLWKKELLGSIFSATPALRQIHTGWGGVKSPIWHISSLCHADLLPLRRLFYPESRKILPLSILEEVDPLALCIWYLDDGSLNRSRGSAELATDSFSREENLALVEWFSRRWDITARIVPIVRHGHDLCHVRFLKSSTDKLIDLLRCFEIPDCMRYKLSRSLTSALPRRASADLAE